MCKENLYANMEKLEAQICRCTRHGLKVRPWLIGVQESLIHPKMNFGKKITFFFDAAHAPAV